MELRLDLSAIRENARRVRERVDGTVLGVVKGAGARREVVDAFVEAGVDAIAVSRVEHLRALQHRDVDLVMLRVPAKSEIADVVDAADLTLHASLEVVRRAQREAVRQGTVHRIVPLIDAGDHREGIELDQAEARVGQCEDLAGIDVERVGVNLGCFGDRPDPRAVRRVADRFPEYPLSVGGSGMLLIHDSLPDSVSTYRIGDAILTGKWLETPIPGLRRNTVELRAEVLASRADESVVDVGSVNSDPRHLLPKGGFAIDRWTTEQAVVTDAFDEGELVPFEVEYDALATTLNSTFV
ncbi:MAG: alanine racemase [Haloferacaceae archaeon]